MKNNGKRKKDFIIYNTPNGEVRIDVFLQDETGWLTQKQWGEKKPLRNERSGW